MALFRDARGNLRYVADDYGSMVSDALTGAAEGVRGVLQEKTFREDILPLQEVMRRVNQQKTERILKELERLNQEVGTGKEKKGDKKKGDVPMPVETIAAITEAIGASANVPGMEGPTPQQSPAYFPPVPQMFPAWMAPPDTSKPKKKEKSSVKEQKPSPGMSPEQEAERAWNMMMQMRTMAPAYQGTDPLMDFVNAP